LGSRLKPQASISLHSRYNISRLPSNMRLATKTCSAFMTVFFVVCLETGFAIKRSRSDMLAPDAREGKESFDALPQGSRIALLFRGQVFRDRAAQGNRPGCSTVDKAEKAQYLMTKSALNKIVVPFEMASHTVDIYLFDSSNCSSKLGIIADHFGREGEGPGVGPFWGNRSRVVFQQSFLGSSQSESMARTLHEFRKHGPEKYRAIFLLRHDLIYKTVVYDWPTVNYDKFNFYSHCEKSHPGYDSEDPRQCVVDIIGVMPGKYFAPWQRIVGTGDCFNGKPGKFGRDCGHFCYNQTAEAIGEENIGFVTDWIPEYYIREVTVPDFTMF